MSKIYDDIVWKLQLPLPYNLQGVTTKDLGNLHREAANEIEMLREHLSSCRNDMNYWYERCTRAEACADIMHKQINRKWWKKNAT